MEFVECDACGHLNPSHVTECSECGIPVGDPDPNPPEDAPGLSGLSDNSEREDPTRETAGSDDGIWEDADKWENDHAWRRSDGDDDEPSNRMPLPVLILMAVCVTIGSYGILAGAAMFAYYYTTGHPIIWLEGTMPGSTEFWVIYSILWFVGVVAGESYDPKSNYDFGGPHGNPLTRRNNHDREHATLGCILLPLHLVRYFWWEVAERMSQPK